MAGYIGSKASVTQVDGYNTTEADAEFVNDPNEVITVNSGNVGIGTSSPDDTLDIEADNPTVRLTDNTDSGYSRIRHNTGSLIFEADNGNTTASSAIRFDIDGLEAMRIGAGNNLLVGKTTSATSVVGVEMRESGKVVGTMDGGNHTFNRLTSDGDIIKFQKDTATVGSIGVTDGCPYICNPQFGNSGLYFAGRIQPTDHTGDRSDNTVDLGSSSFRFDDIYATNGTIQTSDQNEKQQIASLTTAEMDAAKAISQLFKTFKWNDSVADKGDAARIHTGVIAQEVEQAMTNAGLDAGDYAFFTSTTWWETQTDVPAVVADPENDVEAKDAYTRTNTYDTAEEAPAGATERTRKGIRYPELLSFVGAATEQRLADIETRLTALEAV